MNFKRIFRGALYVLITLILIGTATILIIDEPIPKGEKGKEAEKLADNILKALNKPAWDSLETIRWTYPLGNHSYYWNKINNSVEVRWDDYKVILDTQNGGGKVYKNDQHVDDGNKIVSKAFKFFYNDSFWLIAPYKIKDPGTIRKIVHYNGGEALLVQYTSGGATPGDSYLWILDDNYKPIAWKFWASIIPIGGMEFTWENWININGAEISTLHKGLIDIEITAVEN